MTLLRHVPVSCGNAECYVVIGVTFICASLRAPLGGSGTSTAGSRTRRQPAPLQTVAAFHRTRQEPTRRQPRHRSGTGRLVLVTGNDVTAGLNYLADAGDQELTR